MAHTTPTPACPARGADPIPSQAVMCPAWCAGGHDGPDPDHSNCVLHAWQAQPIDTDERALRIELTRWDDERGVGVPHLTIFAVNDPYPEVILNPEQALQLITELLDAVNQTLPESEQIFLGPPGFEYEPYDGPWA
jgi:hypothetical protein